MAKGTTTKVKRSRQKKTEKPASVNQLEAARDKAKEDHLLAQRTQESYKRYVECGKEFLKALADGMRTELDAKTSISDAERTSNLEEIQELSEAFSPTPNAQSVRCRYQKWKH